ncbi:SDR family oxidoreductase [Allostreptomyces psammosilenae]|uniref:NADP-dependent 3-hydroxy acid dehydrogenase YdfG n=1 Tax=Allostreptomyces psammosilenae TaxID=1892865 RepID=A0A853A042_9ACTN|nr:SDR family oxidoreductase [Allostreptomyces psammosilenae]NYI07993.1 NADP-dependent 3-hydroxy acid dehydrogenase YdfG [Allostreptomyces psammosilenae]
MSAIPPAHSPSSYTAPSTSTHQPPVAVVTGASSGIGAATARLLAAAGYRVVACARRAERLAELARETGGTAHPLDVTDPDAVRALAESLDRVDVVVANAGGALGVDPVADADPADWRAMYELNVLGTLHTVQALLPKLLASGNGTLVLMGSTAGLVPYEGGGGYTGAKHAVHAMAGTLRLELVGQPVRVVEIAPGMVETEEFSLNRFRGDSAAAARVYEGVPDPLTAEDVADTVVWAVTRPAHVNVDLLVLRPRAQAAQHKVHRVSPDQRG